MILLDPDLDPYPAPAIAARRALPAQPPASRVPSARSLENFLRIARAAVRLRGQVTVLLTTDKAIRKLNREFRGIDKATDVLSFPAPLAGIAGDLAIGVPTALRQAGDEGHSLAIEIKVLLLHGLLHLAGYDHEADEGRMARRERVLRARLGLPQGLIERNGESGTTALKGDGFSRAVQSQKSVAALAAEGKDGFTAKSPSGAKAPVILEHQMYGLKPVPSSGKSRPSVAGAKAQSQLGAVSARLKSCPVTEPVLASGAKAPSSLGGLMYGLKPVPSSGKSRPPVAGAKAQSQLGAVSARLKSCPVTEPVLASGAKARSQLSVGSARLKSCPDSEPFRRSGKRSTSRRGGKL